MAREQDLYCLSLAFLVLVCHGARASPVRELSTGLVNPGSGPSEATTTSTPFSRNTSDPQVVLHGNGSLHHISRSRVIADFSEDYLVIDENKISEKRQKRSIIGSGDHVIETLFIVDYEAYKKWLAVYRYNVTEAEKRMEIFYHWLSSSLNQRYKHVATQSTIINSLEIRLIGLLIQKKPSDSPWTETSKLSTGFVNITQALEKLTSWVQTRRDLRACDHIMGFTGYNLQKGTNVDVKGLSTLRGMCSDVSVAIIEDDMTQIMASVAAHELGHCLGASHDIETSGCSDSDNYIMATTLLYPTSDTLAPRLWQFSPCSIRKFEETLSSVTCTTHTYATSRSIVRTGSMYHIGQTINADEQCQMSLGQDSKFGRRVHMIEGYKSLCRGMYCEVNTEGHGTSFSRRIPLDGTSCGYQQWCNMGQCVSDPDAPSREDNCPQGDAPSFPCQKFKCSTYPKRIRLGDCCHTCSESRAPETNVQSLNNSRIATQKASIIIANGPLPTREVKGVSGTLLVSKHPASSSVHRGSSNIPQHSNAKVNNQAMKGATGVGRSSNTRPSTINLKDHKSSRGNATHNSDRTPNTRVNLQSIINLKDHESSRGNITHSDGRTPNTRVHLQSTINLKDHKSSRSNATHNNGRTPNTRVNLQSTINLKDHESSRGNTTQNNGRTPNTRVHLQSTINLKDHKSSRDNATGSDGRTPNTRVHLQSTIHLKDHKCSRGNATHDNGRHMPRSPSELGKTSNHTTQGKEDTHATPVHTVKDAVSPFHNSPHEKVSGFTDAFNEYVSSVNNFQQNMNQYRLQFNRVFDDASNSVRAAFDNLQNVMTGSTSKHG